MACHRYRRGAGAGGNPETRTASNIPCSNGQMSAGLRRIERLRQPLVHYLAALHDADMIGKRVLRTQIKPFAPVVFLARYDMNRSTDASCGDFLKTVGRDMAWF